jgi:hypothetical protein
MEKTVGIPQKLKIELLYSPAISLLSTYQKYIEKPNCPSVNE